MNRMLFTRYEATFKILRDIWKSFRSDPWLNHTDILLLDCVRPSRFRGRCLSPKQKIALFAMKLPTRIECGNDARQMEEAMTLLGRGSKYDSVAAPTSSESDPGQRILYWYAFAIAGIDPLKESSLIDSNHASDKGEGNDSLCSTDRVDLSARP